MVENKAGVIGELNVFHTDDNLSNYIFLDEFPLKSRQILSNDDLMVTVSMGI